MGSTKLIRYLNDDFRKNFTGGKVVLSQGIRAMSKLEIAEIMLKVSRFNDFTIANDPYEEHDYGSFEYHGKQIMWKIDYYDTDYVYASEDPADITKTKRLLTILTADEY